MGFPAPGLRRRKQCDLWFSFRPVISLRTSKNFYCATDFEKTRKDRQSLASTERNKSKAVSFAKSIPSHWLDEDSRRHRALCVNCLALAGEAGE